MRLLNSIGLLPDEAGEPLIEWWRICALVLIPIIGLYATFLVVGWPPP